MQTASCRYVAEIAQRASQQLVCAGSACAHDVGPDVMERDDDMAQEGVDMVDAAEGPVAQHTNPSPQHKQEDKNVQVDTQLHASSQGDALLSCGLTSVLAIARRCLEPQPGLWKRHKQWHLLLLNQSTPFTPAVWQTPAWKAMLKHGSSGFHQLCLVHIQPSSVHTAATLHRVAAQKLMWLCAGPYERSNKQGSGRRKEVAALLKQAQELVSLAKELRSRPAADASAGGARSVSRRHWATQVL